MLRFSSYLLGITMLFFSCKKDQLPEIPDSNDPVFSVNGDINGVSFELVAGDENIQMSESIEIINGVDYFSSQLSNDQESVTIKMADGELDQLEKNWSLENISSIDLLPSYEEPLQSIGVFDFSNSQMITSINWEVNGNAVNGEKIDFNAPGRYDVCGTFTFLGGTSVDVCNELIIGFERTTEAELKAEPLQGYSFRLELDTDNNNITEIAWYVNDSLFSSDPITNFTADIEHNFIRCEYITADGGSKEKTIYLNRDNPEIYVQDFGYFENYSGEFADYLMNLEFNLSQGAFRAFPYQNLTSVTLDEVTLYEETADKKVYLVKGAFVGKLLNLNTQEIVDGEINFKFAIPMNK
jgi:hypothetical protein